MKWVLSVLGMMVGLIVLGLVLLYIRFVLVSRRHFRQMIEKLRPVKEALRNGKAPDSDTIQNLAANPETRNPLYNALLVGHQVELFPPQYHTCEAFAESELVIWLTHPNEPGSPPDEIELARVVTLSTSAGELDHYLFRFRVHPPHWAAKYGWMAGVSGPYRMSSVESGTAFSRFEAFDSRTPEEHVRAIHEVYARRCVHTPLHENAPTRS